MVIEVLDDVDADLDHALDIRFEVICCFEEGGLFRTLTK